MIEPSDKPNETQHEEDPQVEEEDFDPLAALFKRWSKNPAFESEENFYEVFEIFESTDFGAAETVHEITLVGEASKLFLNIQRLDRIERSILINQQRPAVESLFQKLGCGIKARLEAERYFLDSAFKAQSDKDFESFGYAPDAVEGEAYMRAMPSLTIIHRQKTADRKALFNFLKDFEASVSRRNLKKKENANESTSKPERN